MDLVSPDFVAFTLALLVIFHLYDHPRWHAWAMAVGNGAFVWTWAPLPSQQRVLACLLAGGYAGVWLLQRGWMRSRAALWIYAAALVAVMLQVRGFQAGFAGAESVGAIPLVGCSYLVFKLIHMGVDASQGRLRRLRILDFFNYACGFYTWISGPIQRYDDFVDQFGADAGRPRVEALLAGLDRIANGCLKVLVVAALVEPYTRTDGLLAAERWEWWPLRLAAWYFGYYLWLYLNFSGYTDIVVGIAAWFGMRLPENFNHPYVARNLIDFWQRWHMSLSAWLRDYVFHPLYWQLTRRAASLRWLNAALAYLVTFVVAGLWHGATLNFVVFGLMHGVGAFFNQLCTDLMMKHLPAAWRTGYRKSQLVSGLAVICCATWVAASMLVFAHPFEELRAVWEAVKTWNR